MNKGTFDIFASLNPRQREAVETTEGPVLVLAGAGSGKTRVIAHRIAHIVSKGPKPEQILAVTFTNKAASEMRERIGRLLQESTGETLTSHPFIGTFHSLGVHMLREHGSLVGVPKNFTILDRDDAVKLFKILCAEHEVNTELYDPEAMRSMISRLKNECIGPVTSEERSGSPFETLVAKLYASYESRLHSMSACDFDDLLMKPVLLLENHRDTLAHWQDKWLYMHIDEYQDTNHAQYRLTKLLAGKHGNLCVVGDVDQAIYSWRGADFRNILNFERDFPGTRVIALEDNYRSTKTIIDAAAVVIARNSERRPTTLRTANPQGDKIDVMVYEDERKEAIAIAQALHAQAVEGIPAREMAILYRTNAQSRALEEQLVRSGIPYKLVGGVRFYERKEVRDVLAYLRLIHNPKDQLAWQRAVNTPTRGIGKVLQQKHADGNLLTTAEAKKLAIFSSLIDHAREMVDTYSIHDIIMFIITESGFREIYTRTPEDRERLGNMEELASVAEKYSESRGMDGLSKFLEEVGLATDQDSVDEKANVVHLMTIHAAKGLEFSFVIIAGMEEGIFPHVLSRDEGRMEEERRLFYVALTRAKKRLLLTLTSRRMLFGELQFNDPSRFLGELPEELTQVAAEKSMLDDGPSISYDSF